MAVDKPSGGVSGGAGGGLYAVMCCGCLRVLGVAGELLPLHGGVISWDRAGKFASYKQADVAAKRFGWTVADPDGTPNHRCPMCAKAAKEERPGAGKGAYLEVPGEFC